MLTLSWWKLAMNSSLTATEFLTQEACLPPRDCRARVNLAFGKSLEQGSGVFVHCFPMLAVEARHLR